MSSGIDFWLLIFNSDALEERWTGFERVEVGEIEKGHPDECPFLFGENGELP
jgi:hypothetical protein